MEWWNGMGGDGRREIGCFWFSSVLVGIRKKRVGDEDGLVDG